MSNLPQADFSSLGLVGVHDTDIRPLDGFQELKAVQHAGSTDSLKSVKQCGVDESYRPINFISDEACELIWNWERSYLKQQETNHSVDTLDVESITNSLQCVFEPMRSMSESKPPPKRFYRTLWRLLTRRILEHEK